MNSLAQPWFLLCLGLVPVLTFLRYHNVRKPTMRVSGTAHLRNLSPAWTLFARWMLPGLYVIGLSLLVLTLCKPQKGLSESLVKTEVVDIILLVDVSSSMKAEDFSEGRLTMNRLDSAKQVLTTFVKRREHDRIGIVAFAALPYSMSPLTLDHDWLQHRITSVSTDVLEDGTAIGSALASAVNRLRDSEATSKLVILLTDGENNAGSVTPEVAAQAAKALDIRVYTVGAGTDGWVPIPYKDRLGNVHYRKAQSRIDELTLKKIADITGASYFRARDFAGLQAIYGEIDRMEKTEIELEQYTQYEARFAPFLLIAILCLAAEKLLSYSRLGRLP